MYPEVIIIGEILFFVSLKNLIISNQLQSLRDISTTYKSDSINVSFMKSL
ncbi:MAG: hypothetical protein Q8S84_09200 [bacterium]|nr:hypothetical protein [bacterium]